VLLTATPKVDYLHRATALSYAAAQLHLQFLSGDLTTRLSRGKNKNCSIYNNIFGVSIVPGQPDNHICTAKESCCINVLFRGNAYLIEIIENGKVSAPEVIYATLTEIVRQNPPLGATGLLRAVPLPIAYQYGKLLNFNALEKLSQVLFHLCLDEVVEDEPPDQNALFTSIFSGNRHNRWYGSMQIVVRTDGEAAFIFSYMCGLDGVQANEVAVELYQRAQDLNWSDAPISPNPITSVSLDISEQIHTELQQHAAPLFHDCPSVLTIPFGVDFFKNIQLSPNIAIHFLLMLAFRDVGDLPYLPETSQAIVVREQFWGGVQLDWLRARPELLRQFLENPTDIELFRQTVAAHQQLIDKSRESLSQFLFFDNRAEDKKGELINFYLALGQDEAVGAYRHYLCPITRAPQALDIITSSLRLWDGIQLIGRPGTRSRLVNFSGTHILFTATHTCIVFTPTLAWEKRLPQVMERLQVWMLHLADLSNIKSGEIG